MILLRAIAMDHKEFATIVNRTKAIVLKAVQKHLAAQFYEAIDDVVQETYIRAYKSLVAGKFKSESTLETWLYRIAANESKRMNQKLFRELKKVSRIAVAMDDSMEVVFDGIEIKKMIEKLPLIYKDVLQLKAQGECEENIAKRLNLPRGTVKSRLSRGKQILYKLLQEEI